MSLNPALLFSVALAAGAAACHHDHATPSNAGTPTGGNAPATTGSGGTETGSAGAEQTPGMPTDAGVDTSDAGDAGMR